MVSVLPNTREGISEVEYVVSSAASLSFGGKKGVIV